MAQLLLDAIQDSLHLHPVSGTSCGDDWVAPPSSQGRERDAHAAPRPRPPISWITNSISGGVTPRASAASDPSLDATPGHPPWGEPCVVAPTNRQNSHPHIRLKTQKFLPASGKADYVRRRISRAHRRRMTDPTELWREQCGSSSQPTAGHTAYSLIRSSSSRAVV